MKKMHKSLSAAVRGVLVAAAMVAIGGSANAAIIDGIRDLDYGLPVAVQKNTTNSSPQGDPNEFGQLTATAPYTQTSAAYGTINPGTGKLSLFIAGSINLNNVNFYIAIDADPGAGVGSLHDAGVPSLPGNLAGVTFDTGFAPEKLIRFEFDAGSVANYYGLGTNTSFGYSSGGNPSDTPAVPITIAGSGEAPGFVYSVDNSESENLIPAGTTSITTGFEIEFDLTALGWVPGSPINVLTFVTHGGNNGMTNQYFGGDAFNPQGNLDDYYIDQNRQFSQELRYPGAQFFTVQVPEPASLGLASMAGMLLLGRRSKRRV